MLSYLTVILALAVLTGLAVIVSMPRVLRNFCIAPRILCKRCANADTCPMRAHRMRFQIEPRSPLRT